MQGIGRIAGAGGAVPARGAPRRGQAFRVQAEAGAAAAEVAAAAGVAAPGLSLLALQESGSGAERDAAAQRRAEDLLEELAGLQSDLLAGGGGDPGRLARLAALEAGEEGADPRLQEVVRAVALRARIELARRNRGNPATLG
ncbi:flagellar assembly protein FliX [Paeniroseomonas aquatica]|uniref:Flagellar assembly protein FliX n=1 Tax=Paeniroseomonas aquatica TaxID=373043 RepID=A0ABT8AC47_9PROT|nr:flagellar assembly protein FliX [Paeniroseomonas aquatica]MDN3567384.1 flagellar assembly protein FliX [Paeniroseomonas aquatica]